MFAASLFAAIVAALDSVWIVSGVFAILALLVVALILYGLRTASGLKNK